MNKKLFFIFLLVILIINNINAKVIEEKTLEELGYDNLIIEKNTEGCENYLFKKIKLQNNSNIIFQMKIDNYIPTSNDVSFKIFLNNILEKEIKNKDIKKNNIIELNNLKEDNNLSICYNNKFLPKIIISNKSKIGSYLLAKIDNNGFYQKIPDVVYANTLTPIDVIIRNDGYAPIRVKVTNATKKFLENSTLENVSGETSFDGIIKEKETKRLRYFIKVNKNINYISPRAIIEYTDEFGNKIKKYTENKLINVKDSKNKLEAYIDIEKNIEKNKPVYGKLILRNTSEEDIKNINILSNFDGKIILNSESIDIIKKKNIKEIPFEIKTNRSKEYYLKFIINYTINKKIENTESKEIIIKSENKENKNIKIISVLLTITILLYLWIFKF